MEGLRRRIGIWKIDSFLYRGAEAEIYMTTFLGEKAVLKARLPKEYRHPVLDQRVRRTRTHREAFLLHRAKRMGVRTPLVWFVDMENYLIVMEFIEGRSLREALIGGVTDWREIAGEIGRDVAALHNGDIVHGDLTTSNIILTGTDLAYFDFGLGETTRDIEGKAGDLELFYRVIHSTHPNIEGEFIPIFLEEYRRDAEGGRKIIQRFNKIIRMGRYIPREERILP